MKKELSLEEIKLLKEAVENFSKEPNLKVLPNKRKKIYNLFFKLESWVKE